MAILLRAICVWTVSTERICIIKEILLRIQQFNICVHVYYDGRQKHTTVMQLSNHCLLQLYAGALLFSTTVVTRKPIYRLWLGFNFVLALQFVASLQILVSL